MEERKLNEKESLELIAQMIQNTKNRLETNCGMPFLFWGYTTLFVSLLIWFLVVTTRNYYWQYLFFCTEFNIIDRLTFIYFIINMIF